MGGGFSDDQAFTGSLQGLYVLKRALTVEDVKSIYNMKRRTDISHIFSGKFCQIQHSKLIGYAKNYI